MNINQAKVVLLTAVPAVLFQTLNNNQHSFQTECLHAVLEQDMFKGLVTLWHEHFREDGANFTVSNAKWRPTLSYPDDMYLNSDPPSFNYKYFFTIRL